MADQVVLIGPEDCESAQAPATRPPINHASASRVEFWTAYGGADIEALNETGMVKAYAAVTPNEDGHVTIYLNTNKSAEQLEGAFTVIYRMVTSYPRPDRRVVQTPITIAERLLMAIKVPPRTSVSTTPLRIQPNEPLVKPENPGLPPQIVEAFPDKAGWMLFDLFDLKNAEAILGGLESRIKLEDIAWATRPQYKHISGTRVLVAPDGKQAAILYENQSMLIMIPAEWSEGIWSMKDPVVSEKNH
ncbi:MAG: hypothetical protein ACM3XN_02440 [Chloroflexota bacterium]